MKNDDQQIRAQKIIDYVRLIEVNGDPNLVSEAKILLTEYGDYMFKDLGLIAGKQNFFNQLEQFPGDSYLPPSGIFIVANAGDTLMGCVGARKFDKYSCEMKRMYIRSAFRGAGIGTLLCNFIIEWCRKSGYRRILLDTNAEMKEAVFLYKKCGFKEIKPYCINENNHPVYMEYALL